MEVRDVPRQTDVTDPDLRLDAPRAVDDADQPPRGGRRIDDPGRDRQGRGWSRPCSQQTLRHRRYVLTGQIAGHDQRRARRVQGSFVGPPDDVRGQVGDGLPGACRRPVVRRLVSVDRPDVRLVGAAPRIGLGLEEVIESLVAQALYLTLRKRGTQQDLCEQLQRGLQAGGRDVNAQRRGIPAGLGMEGGAQPL